MCKKFGKFALVRKLSLGHVRFNFLQRDESASIMDTRERKPFSLYIALKVIVFNLY